MSKSELPYEQKVQEFLEEMKSKGVISLYGSHFSDDPFGQKGSKYSWYRKECMKLLEEFKTEATISEKRMKEIMEFAKIEKYFKENLERKKMSVLEKAGEYRDKVLELKRDIKESDHLYFSNGDRMKGWLYRENIGIRKELESNSPLTKERIAEIDTLGEINFLVTEVFPKKQKLSFDEKAYEYQTKLYELGRDIENTENIRFSNGESMPGWLNFQVKNLRITTMRDGAVDEHRLSVLANIFDCKQRLKEESMIASTVSRYDAYLDQYAQSKIGPIINAYYIVTTPQKNYQKVK